MQTKSTLFKILFTSCGLVLRLSAWAQSSNPNELILGRWEVTGYSEQGIQVDKQTDPITQARKVYHHIRKQRGLMWYGFDEEGLERKTRSYLNWVEEDSLLETRRIAKLIEMPYYAVFFPDSTLALYNKDKEQNIVYAPEAKFYRLQPDTKSIKIQTTYGAPQWHIQLMELSAEKMVLFIAEDAEIVTLKKVEFVIP